MTEKKKRDFEPLPYYRWYWRDARASRRWQRMHFIARGLYRELLDECWVSGGIPNDIAQLADICGCPEKVMRTHWNEIERMFVSVGEGWLTSERIEHERTDSDKVRAANALAGQRSGESRKRKGTNANESERALTNVPSTRTSSSSSSSEQSKSSSVRSDERPAASLGPEGPRRDARFSLIKDAIDEAANRIGFRPEGEQ